MIKTFTALLEFQFEPPQIALPETNLQLEIYILHNAITQTTFSPCMNITFVFIIFTMISDITLSTFINKLFHEDLSSIFVPVIKKSS